MSQPLLELRNVNKRYPSFSLQDISFSLYPGHIMGFIGRNGAGKTTTLKAIYGLLSIDSGEILFEGEPVEKEKGRKEEIGILFGGIDCHPSQTLSTLTSVTKRFYPHWDEACYQRWIHAFELDEKKKIKELSNGMKTKYLLSVALSHGAKLLLLDEPTSGLDPVSRDELLDALRDIATKEEVGILFSTHVISDLEKIADDITYIRSGSLLASCPLKQFEDGYYKVTGEVTSLTQEQRSRLMHCRERFGRYEGIIPASAATSFEPSCLQKAGLEEIMVGIERGEEQ